VLSDLTNAPYSIATAMPAWARRAFREILCRRRGHRDIFGDLFGEMFSMGGASQRTSRQNRGDDLRFDLAIDFEDAVFGIQKEVRIRRLETALPARVAEAPQAVVLPSAANARARADPLPAGLLLCGSHLRRMQRRRLGHLRSLPRMPWRGRAATEIKLNVKVPPGVEDGTRIRYSAKAMPDVPADLKAIST